MEYSKAMITDNFLLKYGCIKAVSDKNVSLKAKQSKYL